MKCKVTISYVLLLLLFSNDLVKVFLEHSDVVFKVVLLFAHLVFILFNLSVQTLSGALFLFRSTAFKADSFRLIECLQRVKLLSTRFVKLFKFGLEISILLFNFILKTFNLVTMLIVNLFHRSNFSSIKIATGCLEMVTVSLSLLEVL